MADVVCERANKEIEAALDQMEKDEEGDAVGSISASIAARRPVGRKMSSRQSNALAKEFGMTFDGGDGRATMFRKAKMVTDELLTQRGMVKNRNMFIVMLLFFAVLALLSIFAVSLAAVEQAKESHVSKTVLMAKDGKTPVQTKSLETFAKLFDLPAFDINTLSQVKHLTLTFRGGTEGSFAITRALKKKGSKAVTFTSANDDTITVDAESKMAMAEVGGKMYTVDPSGSQAVASRGRRLEEDHGRNGQAPPPPPRLYESHEFFTEANGFVGSSRKLSEDSDMGGFAAVALAAAEAILDKYNTEFGTEHDSIGIQGSFWTKPDYDGASVKKFDVAFFLNVTSGLWAVSRKIIGADGTGHTQIMDTTTLGDSLWFRYDSQSNLIQCEMVPFMNHAAMKEAAGIGDGAISIEGVDITREGTFAIPMDTYNFHGQAVFQQPAAEVMNMPTIAQCGALQPGHRASGTHASGTHASGGRRLRSSSYGPRATIIDPTSGAFHRRSSSEVKLPMRHPVEGFRRELWQGGQSPADENQAADEARSMLHGPRQLDADYTIHQNTPRLKCEVPRVGRQATGYPCDKDEDCSSRYCTRRTFFHEKKCEDIALGTRQQLAAGQDCKRHWQCESCHCKDGLFSGTCAQPAVPVDASEPATPWGGDEGWTGTGEADSLLGWYAAWGAYKGNGSAYKDGPEANNKYALTPWEACEVTHKSPGFGLPPGTARAQFFYRVSPQLQRVLAPFGIPKRSCCVNTMRHSTYPDPLSLSSSHPASPHLFSSPTSPILMGCS